MPKSKYMLQEVEDNNVVQVNSTLELPWKYIPYQTLAQARHKHPTDTLYVYVGQKPGWQIIAFPVVMFEPKEVEDGDQE